jgi:hypothetical protein
VARRHPHNVFLNNNGSLDLRLDWGLLAFTIAVTAATALHRRFDYLTSCRSMP